MHLHVNCWEIQAWKEDVNFAWSTTMDSNFNYLHRGSFVWIFVGLFCLHHIYHSSDIGSQKSAKFWNSVLLFLFIIHQASGSGSESAVRTQKSSKSKGADDSDNDTDSNDDNDTGSIGLNARDGSDNGSGTQVFVFMNKLILWYLWREKEKYMDSNRVVGNGIPCTLGTTIFLCQLKMGINN